MTVESMFSHPKWAIIVLSGRANNNKNVPLMGNKKMSTNSVFSKLFLDVKIYFPRQEKKSHHQKVNLTQPKNWSLYIFILFKICIFSFFVIDAWININLGRFCLEYQCLCVCESEEDIVCVYKCEREKDIVCVCVSKHKKMCSNMDGD